MFKQLPEPELIKRIKEAGLFDADWYRTRYPDVAALNIDPLEHFLQIGERLGRDPSAKFSTKRYLNDVGRKIEPGQSVLVHYLTHGGNPGVVPFERNMDSPSLLRRRGRTHFEDPPSRAARIIAFHLPQFHAFPENDLWWGKGFTEWTNVKSAKPQFDGHYQPHVPHTDIGYYDLTEPGVFARQIDVAKSHGIFGFCFYFYWFAGKRLMERALEGYLSDKTLDFPFCLCWANENWTRRWDGLDSEVLISQHHSNEDDIACMAELARYLKDERYIRIDGRPLVLIYRPSLLPDAAATAVRWREWCRNNGIGEIYLAYTQSFEKVDPSVYGFDASIEFPPNNSNLDNITESLTHGSQIFNGQIYDWRSLSDRSLNFDMPHSKVWRGLCPGWDNTPRRQTGASILVNNSPQQFELWMKRAVRDTVLRFDNTDERLVFVNAWNEWAEGAHLEPDMRDGYAYLNAIREAVALRSDPPRIAIVIHVYYLDVLPSILALVDHLPASCEIIATTIHCQEDLVTSILSKQSKPFRVFAFENRGRDVLPFIRVLPHLVELDFNFVVKVHTKKSLHRLDGEEWRNQLYRDVIGREAFYRSILAMENNRKIGLVGPHDHFVSIDTYLGSNKERIWYYGQQLGLEDSEISSSGFFAGTMFTARLSSLEPILNLDIREEDFEDEMGQVDGTLAHAIERVISLSVLSRRQIVSSTKFPNEQITINSSYDFA